MAIRETASARMMGRRSFIQSATLIAAGSVLPNLFGCATSESAIIPCLGSAAPPTPAPGMTYIRASEIGCALDCDLATGRNKYSGGGATDDAPRINAALAGATAENPITLILDGSALISGLFMPAGGYWSIAGLGCGTGFFVKTGTNNDGIHNGPPDAAVPSDPGPPVPSRGKNVSLSNFTLNGNRGDGHEGDSTTGTPQGTKVTWYFGINLMNLDKIDIKNLVLVNTPAYHIRFSNVGNVTVSGCVMNGSGWNSDGLHFDGPANDIAISNCHFSTGDDSIALNCPEGYSGNISRVSVTNCTFNSFSLMRLYTTNGSSGRFRIDTVSVSNCNGTLSEAAFLIGLSSGSNPNSVDSLIISDCILTAPTVLGIAENFGSITVKNVTFIPSLSGVWWDGPQANRVAGFLRPSPPYGGITCVGSSLSLENCQIIRNGNMNAAVVILESNSMINTLEFNGFSAEDPQRLFPMKELLNLEGGSVGQLVLNSVDSTNIRTPMEAHGYERVGSVSGAGVLATEWEFPDPIMANEVPYISAKTGRPSIKLNGVVEPYLQS